MERAITLELACGCQVRASLTNSNWSMVRRCKRVRMATKDRVAIEKDHYHEIEARIHELRESIQGR